ncbi:MAG: energy-coupled thiamine transporter ThiT [Lachnospiraceae bacterium]|nr:energy-coupled thiamine transporter ThiT [Lachnospiraceae bacterium]
MFANKVDDGYGGFIYVPTTAGYAALVAIILLLLIGAGAIYGYRNKGRVDIRQMAVTSLLIALAFAASNVKLWRMPMGGSVTLFSMLFICLIGYWYGLGAGMMGGLAYGLLQMAIDPYVISLPQLLVDYVLAFTALGLSGLGCGKKHGLVLGYVAGVLGRLCFAVLSGLIFFAAYTPENMSPFIYSLGYNGAYLAAEGAMTAVLLLVPQVRAGLDYGKRLAVRGH